MPYHITPSLHPNIDLAVHANDPLLLMTKIIERMQASRVKAAVSESGLKALSNI
jgi:hypothetical protein